MPRNLSADGAWKYPHSFLNPSPPQTNRFMGWTHIFVTKAWGCFALNYGWLVVDLPLWKMMEFVSWDDYSQSSWKVIKHVPVTTNQMGLVPVFWDANAWHLTSQDASQLHSGPFFPASTPMHRPGWSSLLWEPLGPWVWIKLDQTDWTDQIGQVITSNEQFWGSFWYPKFDSSFNIVALFKVSQRAITLQGGDIITHQEITGCIFYSCDRWTCGWNMASPTLAWQWTMGNS